MSLVVTARQAAGIRERGFSLYFPMRPDYITGLAAMARDTDPKTPIVSTQVSGSRYVFPGVSPSRTSFALAYGGFEQCNPDYLIQRDAFAFHVLELVASGEGSVTLNGKTSALQPGSIYTYSPKTRLQIRTNGARPMSKYFLCFAGSKALARLQRTGIPPVTVRHLPLFPEVLDILEDLIREGRHQRQLAPEICTAFAELLLLKIEELTRLTAKSNNSAEQQFLRSKRIIDAQSETLADLPGISRAVGVEISQLCRLFRRYQGTSPYQYLLRRKMTLAAEFLMDSNHLVKEAGARVGFADPYHFSRCFKKIHGLPPKEFQLSLQRL